MRSWIYVFETLYFHYPRCYSFRPVIKENKHRVDCICICCLHECLHLPVQCSSHLVWAFQKTGTIAQKINSCRARYPCRHRLQASSKVSSQPHFVARAVRHGTCARVFVTGTSPQLLVGSVKVGPENLEVVRRIFGREGKKCVKHDAYHMHEHGHHTPQPPVHLDVALVLVIQQEAIRRAHRVEPGVLDLVDLGAVAGMKRIPAT